MAELTTLTRECEGVQIPSGQRMMLPKGTEVRITQSLGGSYTVMTDVGYMVRISSENADAIGKSGPSPKASPQAEPAQDASVEKLVWDQLKTCYDPEIPVNIVELGLVYECKITPLPDDSENHRVEIKMTLTAPGCGMGDSIKRDAEAKIGRLPGVKEVNVQLVWEPVWDQSKMSQAAKLQLGMM